MPEPSTTELEKEADQEAAVFAQAMNVEKLLNKLKALDPAKDSLADDEEIQVWIIIFSCSLLLMFDFLGTLSFLYGSSDGDLTSGVALQMASLIFSGANSVST